jgi:capsid protein
MSIPALTSSQKRRARRNRAAAGVPAADYHAAANALQGFGGFGGSGYDGGNQSTRRSWIYWPTLDTKRELSSYSRTEMLKKSRSLRANTGLPNRICGGLADMIGYLQPISMSGDEKWDDLADGHWNDMTSEAGVIDASGNFDIKRMQIEMHKAAFGDGDVLPLAIRNSSDGIMIALYDAAQLASPEGQYGKDWIDGVKINKFRRHTAYGLKDDDGNVRTYSAADALYYSFPQQIGQIRPPTVLRHALNHMVDISEILADVKLTIKVASQMGLYLKHNEMNAGGQLGPMAIQGGLRNEKHPLATGTEVPEKEITVNDIYRAEGGVANLPKGTDVGILHDARPHPNQINLIEHLVRDIAWGVGVAPEILWNIETLRGANNRLVNADLNRWISCRHLRLRAWMKRFRSMWIANEITAGRLPEPPGQAEFWRCTWLPQGSLTADKGREGKLNIELIHNNMRSLATHFGEEGSDWQSELRQISKERRAMRELDLNFKGLAPEEPAPARQDPEE